MGTSAAQFRIMPEDPSINLETIKKAARKIIGEMGGVYSSDEEKPIAFGISALVISLAYPEEKEIDELENKLREIPGVSSVELIDYRRAVG